MTVDKIIIKTITERDIPFCMELKNAAGWNQLEQDWKRLIELSPLGCFTAQLHDGTIVGTATTVSFEDKFGWIGMVLVDPNQRKMGIGTALMNACIEYLKPRVKVIRLDATPMGKPVYERLGFKDEYILARYKGTGSSFPATTVKKISSKELPNILAFDKPIFGADRSNWLSRVFQESPDNCFFIEESGKIQGFIMSHPGTKAWYAGPLTANDLTSAEKLLKAVLSSLPGKEIFIDPLTNNKTFTGLLQNVGFTEERILTRMFLGENLYPGTPEKVFCIAGPEAG
ncbi:MAG: hypothetical protein A2231_06290 [Candidatus Firestonebacteria bacterium RIFOXYA2_FULL_40_8]|nr:MAG: hypothetical protein A2231_06290 [Candidatus Firestonebacteria bacterium RIFOXYA2_FULL_40_8]